jgi:hypothetical protein
MNYDDLLHESGEKRAVLEANPSFIWPDARIHAGQARYDGDPPGRAFLLTRI